MTEDFASYIRRKRNEHAHGNHIEMQALSEMYNRPIEVYQYSCGNYASHFLLLFKEILAQVGKL